MLFASDCWSYLPFSNRNDYLSFNIKTDKPILHKATCTGASAQGHIKPQMTAITENTVKKISLNLHGLESDCNALNLSVPFQ
jgi:hypothetical protein